VILLERWQEFFQLTFFGDDKIKTFLLIFRNTACPFIGIFDTLEESDA